jgi:hypothetical protein
MERELCAIIGARLGLLADELEVRGHAAAAVRVPDEHIRPGDPRRADLTEFKEVPPLSRRSPGRYALAIRTATGGTGDPVA